MIITLNEKQMTWCYELALVRSGSVGHSEKSLINKTSSSIKNHFLGVRGEAAFSIVSGIKMDTTTFGRGDGGIDFKTEHGTIQVKASPSKYRPNLLVPPDKWEKNTADIYVLVWVKKNICNIIGYITFEDMKRVHKFTDYGNGKTYFISNYYLKDIRGIL